MQEVVFETNNIWVIKHLQHFRFSHYAIDHLSLKFRNHDDLGCLSFACLSVFDDVYFRECTEANELTLLVVLMQAPRVLIELTQLSGRITIGSGHIKHALPIFIMPNVCW